MNNQSQSSRRFTASELRELVDIHATPVTSQISGQISHYNQMSYERLMGTSFAIVSRDERVLGHAAFQDVLSAKIEVYFTDFENTDSDHIRRMVEASISMTAREIKSDAFWENAFEKVRGGSNTLLDACVDSFASTAKSGLTPEDILRLGSEKYVKISDETFFNYETNTIHRFNRSRRMGKLMDAPVRKKAAPIGLPKKSLIQTTIEQM